VGAGGGDGGGQSVFAGKTLKTLDAVSSDVVVPIGAEAAAAAAAETAAAAAVKAAVGSDQQRQQQSVLQAIEVQEIVMFYIPDGHTKHNTAS
jgi:pyocin large subunit-like protein